MKYGFKVYQVNINGELLWFAESTDLKYCAGQGNTCDEAIKELEENENTWLEMAKEDGIKILDPTVEEIQTYSGKFTVRLSKTLHKQAAERAEFENVSLNQFVVEAISEKVGTMSKQDIKKFYQLFGKFTSILLTTNGILNGTINRIYDVNEMTYKLLNNLYSRSRWDLSQSVFQINEINGGKNLLCN